MKCKILPFFTRQGFMWFVWRVHVPSKWPGWCVIAPWSIGSSTRASSHFDKRLLWRVLSARRGIPTFQQGNLSLRKTGQGENVLLRTTLIPVKLIRNSKRLRHVTVQGTVRSSSFSRFYFHSPKKKGYNFMKRDNLLMTKRRQWHSWADDITNYLSRHTWFFENVEETVLDRASV